ncbi:MAG: C45 family peptidase [Fuerstiella sp.]|nr:C45 family peptidase [Fuerstiella sp.]
MAPFHVVELRGTSRERGEQYGRTLRKPIERAIEFYGSFFRKQLGFDRTEVRRRSALFIEPTSRLSKELITEYEGIAAGSGQTLEDIFSISARYEITFEEYALGECSNVYVGPEHSATGHCLLGQSWDWRPEVMDFRAIVKAHCDDLPDHIMITECGQPGKYGFNEHGIGVVAAGLNCEEKTSVGDQLFVALGRVALQAQTLSAACQVLENFAPRATVNCLLADSSGDAANFEYAPHKVARRDLAHNEVYWHTNHCREVDEPTEFENSLVRGERWTELTKNPNAVTPELVQEWLADRSSSTHSICQLVDLSQPDSPTRIQTLASIVLDLTSRTMWASDGPASETPYQSFRLSED